ncbi:SPW repeat protein [Bradyrhizobium sp. INPA01-394B]|uniref:SPW repeat protein n=1 Tax=Bradyrhizobium campsiandrae TaxID=1729892 RepID=A0ABR7U293_9BRAD|nr:SPW repeat protein [Bradyrhizobium campsiandrae]MBC9877676.1 SPW repeat protein [Bradyrhizobium campsiandrae]MBC9978085.1 SPW repeat protein [Bradyrhizobium campsiandrae]
MFKRNWKTEAFVDAINLALGGFLFLSPWLLGFRSPLGWHTSWMAGATIITVAIFSLADLLDSVSIPAFFESEEWINLTIGSWLAVCPWVLSFNDDTMAMQVHLAVGIVIATIAAVELWVLRHSPA